MTTTEEKIPIYYDEEFKKKTEYHLIDPEYPAYTTTMFKVMKHYLIKDKQHVVWILKNKSLTINNIEFLEENGWEIIGVEHLCNEIYNAKKDFGFDNVNIKLTIRKKY